MNNDYRLVRYRNDGDFNSESVCLTNNRGKVVAVMKAVYREEGIAITYISVASQYRRKGLGTYLLQSYLDCVSKANDFIPVEVYYLRNERSDELDSFFEAQGNFTVTQERSLYRITPKQRRNNKKWKKFSVTPGEVEEIFGQNMYLPGKVRAELEKTGFGEFFDEDENYSRRLSLVSLGKGGTVKAAILGKVHSVNEIELAFLYKQSGEVKGLWDVIGAWCNVVDELYPNAEIWFCATNPNSAALADSFFGSDARTGGTNIARWNGVGVGEMAEFHSMINKFGLKL